MHSGRLCSSLGCSSPLRRQLRLYYTSRPDDPRAVYLTRERFGAVGDGTTDDSDAIQKAIDAVQESTGEGIVFVPEGRYRISRTLYVWPSIRVIGYGANRPAFVLGPRTPGFDDPEHERQLVFFAGRRPAPGAVPDDANPGTFYSALSNVDLEIQDGNAGAVGVRAKYAQHCFTSHVEFRIGSGLAGVHEGGNVAEDVHFVGGDYGIWTGTPSPGWQYTLVDASFEGQRRTAIREHEAGLTLIRPHFTRGSDSHRDRRGIARRAVGQGRASRRRVGTSVRDQLRRQPTHRDQHGRRRLPAGPGLRRVPRERAAAGGAR